MKEPKVIIIILNYNGKKVLQQCVEAVSKQTYSNFQTIIVDNGSIDDSLSTVTNGEYDVTIIKLATNTGYAGGNNTGIQYALSKNPEYVVCLNYDTIPDRNWLKELVQTAEQEERIGMVSSKAYFTDGKTINNAGLALDKQIFHYNEGGVSLGYGLTDSQAPMYSEDIDIFCASGVAPLYRASALMRIRKVSNEFFDKDFFAYAEDLDLGYRIRLLGYTAKLSSRASLIHLHSFTLGAASPMKTYYVERNVLLTAMKNLPMKSLLAFPFRNIRAKLKYATSNSSVKKLKSSTSTTTVLKIIAKAHLSALLLLPKMLRKRHQILGGRKVRPETIKTWFKKYAKSETNTPQHVA